MTYPLTIHCPPMRVNNTSRWNPWADREAEQLVCDVDTFDRDGAALAFKIVFPKCKIWRDTNLLDRQIVARLYSLPAVPSAVWMVEPVVARSPLGQPEVISVSYPQEPTIRGSLFAGGLIDVLPVNSQRGWVTLPNGMAGFVRSTLPRTTGRPVGLGLWSYVVDACDCEGTVDWE